MFSRAPLILELKLKILFQHRLSLSRVNVLNIQTVVNNSAFCTRETFVKRSTKFKWFTQFGRGAGERRLGLRFRQTLAEDDELDGTVSLRDPVWGAGGGQ